MFKLIKSLSLLALGLIGLVPMFASADASSACAALMQNNPSVNIVRACGSIQLAATIQHDIDTSTAIDDATRVQYTAIVAKAQNDAFTALSLEVVRLTSGTTQTTTTSTTAGSQAGTSQSGTADQPASPRLQLLTPAAGANLVIGSTYQVTWSWNSSGESASQTAVITRTPTGSTAGAEASANITNNGQYSWTLNPTIAPGTYNLKLCVLSYCDQHAITISTTNTQSSNVYTTGVTFNPVYDMTEGTPVTVSFTRVPANANDVPVVYLSAFDAGGSMASSVAVRGGQSIQLPVTCAATQCFAAWTPVRPDQKKLPERYKFYAVHTTQLGGIGESSIFTIAAPASTKAVAVDNLTACRDGNNVRLNWTRTATDPVAARYVIYRREYAGAPTQWAYGQQPTLDVNTYLDDGTKFVDDHLPAYSAPSLNKSYYYTVIVESFANDSNNSPMKQVGVNASTPACNNSSHGTLSISQVPPTQTIFVAGAQQAMVGAFNVSTVGSSEAIRITKLPFDLQSGPERMDFRNLSACILQDTNQVGILTHGANTVEPTNPLGGVSTGRMLFTLDNPLTIPAGVSHRFEIRCNIAASTADTSAFRWFYDRTAPENVFGATTNTSIVPTFVPDAIEAPYLTVRSSGSYTVTKSPTSVLGDPITWISGSVDAKDLASFQFSAQYEDIVISTIRFGANFNGSNPFGAVTFWDKDTNTMIGQGTFADLTVGPTAKSFPVALTLPAGQQKTILIRGVLNSSVAPGSVNSIFYDNSQHTSNYGFGTLSGMQIYPMVIGGSIFTAQSINVIASNSTQAPTVSLTSSQNPIQGGRQFTLSWTVANATACNATGLWGGAKDATTGTHTQVLTADAQGTMPHTEYYYLTCTGPGGTSDRQSIAETVTAPTSAIQLSTPTNVSANVLDQLTVGWSSVPNATSYEVYITPSTAMTYVGGQSTTVPANVPMYTMSVSTLRGAIGSGTFKAWVIAKSNSSAYTQSQAASSNNFVIPGTTAPTLSAAPSQVTFSAVRGTSGSPLQTQSVTITTTAATFAVSIPGSPSWLTATKNGNNIDLSLTPYAYSLNVGNYQATVVVSATGAPNANIVVMITSSAPTTPTRATTVPLASITKASTQNSINLDWPRPDSITTSYDVYRTTNPTAAWNQSSINSVSFGKFVGGQYIADYSGHIADTGLTPNTTYYYYIFSVAGASGPNNSDPIKVEIKTADVAKTISMVSPAEGASISMTPGSYKNDLRISLSSNLFTGGYVYVKAWIGTSDNPGGTVPFGVASTENPKTFGIGPAPTSLGNYTLYLEAVQPSYASFSPRVLKQVPVTVISVPDYNLTVPPNITITRPSSGVITATANISVTNATEQIFLTNQQAVRGDNQQAIAGASVVGCSNPLLTTACQLQITLPQNAPSPVNILLASQSASGITKTAWFPIVINQGGALPTPPILNTPTATNGVVNLSWQPGTSSSGGNYEIYRRLGQSFGTITVDQAKQLPFCAQAPTFACKLYSTSFANNSSQDSIGIQAGSTYYYRASTQDGDGRYSTSLSNEVSYQVGPLVNIDGLDSNNTISLQAINQPFVSKTISLQLNGASPLQLTITNPIQVTPSSNQAPIVNISGTNIINPNQSANMMIVVQASTLPGSYVVNVVADGQGSSGLVHIVKQFTIRVTPPGVSYGSSDTQMASVLASMKAALFKLQAELNALR